MDNKYSPEQIIDVQEREKKALDFLKELELTPSAILSMQNNGKDVFGIKVQPYLQDTKYQNKVSPLQQNDIIPTTE